MLELKTVTWQNFMSYGDYETSIDIENLGQCLITGRVNDDDDQKVMVGDGNPLNITKSNGAGKSSIPNVIQWILFGRTMHTAAPGDKVINWFTGKNCWGRVDFKNGDSIMRTRATNGHDELLFIKDGDETSLTSNTLSTTKNQQARLSREFNLDWEIFCGSVFFNQYGKPWMEMADQTRKKAIERILHVDRFAYYANVAKAKCAVIDSDIKAKRIKVESTTNEIARYENQLKQLEESSENFNTNKIGRIKRALTEAIAEKKNRDDIQRPDLDQLQLRWDIVDKIEKKLTEKRKQLHKLAGGIAELEGNKRSLDSKINNWEIKSGKICITCSQKITKTYVANKIEPIKQQLVEIVEKIRGLQAEKDKINADIIKVQEFLSQKSPPITMVAARDFHNSWDSYDKSIKRLKKSAGVIKDEENPHIQIIEEINNIIKESTEKIKKTEEDIERFTFLNRHFYYIQKAYSDRTKVKSYVFQEHVPFINSRLRHYLDVFGLDIHIELTSALGITSDKWGYEFESGGERKRTDVAFMLAMFDFHEQMYGRQCNMLVLDEVDGRLDDDGIDSLISIIKNDLAPKVETILVISHRNMMFDTFSREIVISRDNRFSQLVSV